MSFPWAPLIGGAASAVGAAFGYKGQQDANEASAEEAQKNREFQERTMKHAIRWRVEDMKAAGINPLLAAGFGGGSASGSMATFGNPAQALAQALSSTGIATAKAQEEVNLTKELKDKTRAEKKLADASLPGIESSAKVQKRQNEIKEKYLKSKFGTIMEYIKNALNQAGGFAGGAIKGLMAK